MFSHDKIAGQIALQHLLWCTLADDFEIRGKAISMIVGYVTYHHYHFLFLLVICHIGAVQLGWVGWMYSHLNDALI